MAAAFGQPVKEAPASKADLTMLLSLVIPLVVTAFFALAVYRARPDSRARLFAECVLLLAAYLLYKAVRALTEGSTEMAQANADRIIELQQYIGVYVEPAINAAVAERAWLVNLANWIYIWGHWPFIIVVAIWLYRANPGGYRITRNAILISGAIGFACFALLPTAPPRLLPDTTFIDTVAEHSNAYRLLQPPSVTNQYAAFPSLHLGWNLLAGLALVRYARRPRVRLFGAIMPVAMALATIATANHFMLDLAMGALAALAGLTVASRLARWSLTDALRPYLADRPARRPR